MNLYEFSQQNNNEMGIYISKAQDADLYNATLEEVQRLLTISEEIRVTVKKVTADTPPKSEKNFACVHQRHEQHDHCLNIIGERTGSGLTIFQSSSLIWTLQTLQTFIKVQIIFIESTIARMKIVRLKLKIHQAVIQKISLKI